MFFQLADVPGRRLGQGELVVAGHLLSRVQVALAGGAPDATETRMEGVGKLGVRGEGMTDFVAQGCAVDA